MVANVKVTSIEKTNKLIFKMAPKTMDVKSSEIVKVGDRVSSDIRCAKKAGIKSVIVKTGESKNSNITGGVQPDYVIEPIDEIENFVLN